MKRRRSSSGSLIELVVIVATAIGLALGIQAFLVKPFRIPSPSMEPTLVPGQRVLVNRIGTHFHEPEVGDIIVFHPPAGATDDSSTGQTSECGNPQQGDGHDEPCDRPTADRSGENFIKRVVGLPGDRIVIKDSHVIRNGRPEKDSYIRPCPPREPICSFKREIVIPPGHYFMMGDNRADSADSRYWGPIPKKWVIGGAFATYWPPNRINVL